VGQRNPTGILKLVRPEGQTRQLNTPVPKLLCLALAAYGALFALLILAHPFGGRAFLTVSDVAGIVPPLLAGALALRAAQPARGHVLTGWRFVGAGCFAWAAGEALWTLYEVGLQQGPFPSPADAGYLAMLPLMAVGVIYLTSEGRGLANSRLTLEGLALVLASMAFVWFFVLHPTYSESSATLLEKVIGAAYPIGDLVLCYAVAIGIQRQWGERDALVLTTLLCGLLLLVAADVGFAYQSLQDTYTETSLVNLGWPFGFLCIGLTAILSRSWTLTYSAWADGEVNQVWRSLLPVGMLIPLIVVVASAFQNDSRSAAMPVAAFTALSGLALVLRTAINVGLVQNVEGAHVRLLSWIEDDVKKRRAA